MLGTLGTTRADFVRLRRSASPVFRHSPASGRSGDPRPLALGSRATGSSCRLAALTGQVRVRLVRGFGCVAPGRQVDASVVGPIVCRLAECSELVGVLVSATVAGELCDGVAELLDVDGVAAGPSIPQLEGFDLSSQDRDLVEGVAEPNPACRGDRAPCVPRRRVPAPGCTGRCQGGCVAGCVGGVRRRAGGGLRRRRARGGRPVARASRSCRGGAVRRCAATGPDRRVRGGGELLTSRRGRCLDTGEVASRRGGRGRKPSPLNLTVRRLPARQP